MSEYSLPSTVNSLAAEPVALWAASLTASAIAALAWQLKFLTAPGALVAAAAPPGKSRPMGAPPRWVV